MKLKYFTCLLVGLFEIGQPLLAQEELDFLIGEDRPDIRAAFAQLAPTKDFLDALCLLKGLERVDPGVLEDVVSFVKILQDETPALIIYEIIKHFQVMDSQKVPAICTFFVTRDAEESDSEEGTVEDRFIVLWYLYAPVIISRMGKKSLEEIESYYTMSKEAFANAIFPERVDGFVRSVLRQ